MMSCPFKVSFVRLQHVLSSNAVDLTELASMVLKSVLLPHQEQVHLSQSQCRFGGRSKRFVVAGSRMDDTS
jgi:hypothetical protein